MRSPDPTRPTLRRRRRRLALLVAATALLGAGAGTPARAQDAGARPGEDLFGTYQLDARATGVQARYEIENLLPGGSPILDLGAPETIAQFGSGPSGYGLASLAYPGGVVANLQSLVAQTGGPADGIPEYPVKAEAFFPQGPTQVDTSQAGGQQKVLADELGVHVDAAFPGIETSPILSIGSVTTASRTTVEGDMAVSRARVALGEVELLGGVVSIGSLVTDLVAAHDGTSGVTSGGTVATDVRVLGLDASLGPDGLVLTASQAIEAGPLGALTGVLGDLAGPLGDIVGPVQDQLLAILDQAVPAVTDLLAQAGITLSVAEPHDETVASGAATRISSGLSLRFRYEGREQQQLAALIDALPPELTPSIGPVASPLTFLTENHVAEISLAPATVSALATPPFPTFEGSLPDGPIDPAPLTAELGTGGFGDDGFTTTLPLQPEAAPVAPVVTEPLADTVAVALSGALPAALVALALLASPLFGLGATRLADSVLAPAATPCPIRLDEPPPSPRPTR